MSEKTIVMKICSALSNKPHYIKIDQETFSIDHVITEAIYTLKNMGRPLESSQLEQQYQSHQMYVNGQVLSKGSIFSELSDKMETKIINNQEIQVLNVDLIASHSGGSDVNKIIDDKKNLIIHPPASSLSHDKIIEQQIKKLNSILSEISQSLRTISNYARFWR